MAGLNCFKFRMYHVRSTNRDTKKQNTIQHWNILLYIQRNITLIAIDKRFINTVQCTIRSCSKTFNKFDRVRNVQKNACSCSEFVCSKCTLKTQYRQRGLVLTQDQGMLCTVLGFQTYRDRIYTYKCQVCHSIHILRQKQCLKDLICSYCKLMRLKFDVSFIRSLMMKKFGNLKQLQEN